MPFRYLFKLFFILISGCLLFGCGPRLHPVVAREVAIAKQGRPPESIEAVERLGRYGNPGIDGLLLLLSSKNSPVRLATVIELGRLLRLIAAPAGQAAPPDPADQHPTELTAAVKKPGERDKKVQIDRIVEGLTGVVTDDQDWVIRRVAVAILGNQNSPDINPVLISALADKNSSVRQQAVFSLSNKDHSIDPLIVAVLQDGSADETLAVLNLIGRRKIAAAVPEVIQLTADKNWKIRSRAMLTLGEIKVDSDEIVRVLVERLSDPEARAAISAARALVAIGRPDGMQAALQRFPDKDLLDNFEKIEKKEPTEDPAGYQESSGLDLP